jgi:hypothetical protein
MEKVGIIYTHSVFYGHLVYFVPFLAYFIIFWVFCVRKNLAALPRTVDRAVSMQNPIPVFSDFCRNDVIKNKEKV